MSIARMIATVSLLVVAVVLTNPASAREGHGFLADVGVATGIITPGQADTLDDVHARLGAPLNQFNPLNQGGFQPAQPPAPQFAPRLGNFCATPQGVFGPGPLNPVGMPCHAPTPWGVFFGQVI